MKNSIHTVEVKGPLSYFFPVNVDITEDIAKTIVGLPIKNCNHIIIGKIDSINWEAGEWSGRIVVDDSIRNQILAGYRNSIEVVFEEEKEKIEVPHRIFNIGDEVVSLSCPTLIGKIIKFPRNGTDKGLAIVKTTDGQTLIVSLSHWRKVVKEGEDG